MMIQEMCAVLAIALAAPGPLLQAAEKAEPVSAPALRVPAFTAYAEPNPNALKISERAGVSGWSDAKDKVVWHGNLKSTGRMDVALSLRLPQGAKSKFKLTVAEKTLDSEAIGRAVGAPKDPQAPVRAEFGSVEIPAPGYFSFVLEGVSKDGPTFGELEALVLSGPAAEKAHFNLKPRRNAASVHLGYPIPKDAKIECFYNEATPKLDPVHTFYMACGFHRGYFGMQVNSATERRIIFSVWDSGNEAVSRTKVAAEDRVQLLKKGEGVVAHDFGNEGTGGHSHLVYNWKTGDTYRFLLTAKPDGTHTIYSGYFFFPEKQAWGLIASFRAPKDGGHLRGLHSFNENFVGSNGDRRRLAEFGNQWIKAAGGDWSELLTARFTHDPTGKEDRKDYAAGATTGGDARATRFYLSNGGFIAEPVKYGDEFKRPASGQGPPTIKTAILPGT